MRSALVFVLLASATWAQSAATGQYNEANAHYRSGDFARAREVYLQVITTGVKDAFLFYNLGNACFKSDRLGEAILWYERARRLDPRDEDINANLRFANQVKIDREPEHSGNAVSRFLQDAFFFPTLSELSLVFALGWLGLFVLGIWRLRNLGGRGGLFLAALLCCGITAVQVGSWTLLRANLAADAVSAIVMVEEATARSGPDEAQTEVFAVHEGTKVRVVRGEGEWMLVRLDNGLGGWVRIAVVERI